MDDEDAILFTIARFFGARGFEVDVTHELEEAKALLLERCYAVLIADLRLTGAQGAEGLEAIAYAREHSPSTRTLLLTADAAPDLEAPALSGGAHALLRKPQSLKRIAATIDDLLERPTNAAR